MLRSSAFALLVTTGLVGCAAPRGATRAGTALPGDVAAPSRTAHADVSGVWDWSFRSPDDQRNERFEQEEWHLKQKGTRIEGYYDRVVDMRSLDDRLFRCNQKSSFTKVTRVHVAGEVLPGGNQVQLREVSYESQPGPCDDGARNLVKYDGVLMGANLALRWGPEAGQVLVRRAAGTGRRSLADLVRFEGGVGGNVQNASHVAASTAPVEGTWEWELRSIDAEGDERFEREEWHLTESGEGIRGYYDRTVRRVRGDGVFSCNKQERFETTTRYTIVGQRVNGKLMITEVAYKAEPSACDNALRRLDTYHGAVSDPDTLMLSWGPGNQLLRRVATR